MTPRGPTARQRFLLEHVAKGTVTVTHGGEHFARWNIAMRTSYASTARDRQPSLREGRKLIGHGWVHLEIDKHHYTENTLTKKRIYHHRARLTETGAKVLKES